VEPGDVQAHAATGPVARLGDLERALMEVLWTLAPAPDGRRPVPVTARRIAEELASARPLAYTTVLTVLDRLERKGLVRRRREGRAHLYAPVASRDAYVARVMLEALGTTRDRDAALLRFVEGVSDEEAAVLRRALAESGQPEPAADGDAGR
jgi:predicted transcriptional regulator